jgi:ATP-dependent Zn protease
MKFDRFNPDPDLNRLRISYHEAGHALVAHAQGVEVTEICMGESKGYTDHEEPALIRERLGEERAALALAAIRKAGMFAQMECREDFYGFGCEDDLPGWVQEIERYAEARKRPYTECESKVDDLTKKLVEENWALIQDVAHRLAKKKKISGKEFRQILK